MPKKRVSPTQFALPTEMANAAPYHNQRLFSDHFLENILPKETAWQDLYAEARQVMLALQERFAQFPTPMPFANEAQTEEDWVRPVLTALGHTYEVQTQLRMPGAASPQHPDYVFYASDEQKLAHRGQEIDDRVAQRGAIAVGDAKQWDVPLDQMRKGASDSFSNKNPSFQIFFYMLHSKLPWGILTNGRKWRLYHEDTAYKLEVYYEVDLPDLLKSESPQAITNEEVERFLYFYAFFRRAAFASGHALSLETILGESSKSALKIRDNLRVQVYRALEEVAQGFFAYPTNALTATPETCKAIYENSLILLYRLLFILYAEARALLPVDQKAYEKRYSLQAIKEQIRKILHDGELLLSDAGIIWAQLKTLFRGIDLGNTQLGISTFDGGLFDPHKNEFLQRYTVGDLYLARAIDKLARAPENESDFSERTVIDYRDLSERHLGTIYEGLLEYTLHVASEPQAELRSTSRVVPLAQAAPGDIARTYRMGEVYLLTDTGERKTSGSYYTPDYIVKYMVEQTIKPLLDEAVAGAESNAERVQAVLAINVLDPAMGSGHFPVEVVEYIARYLVELGVQPEEQSMHETDMTYWKRRVAQHCIYGVDLNPLAVELAKLSLWLATAAKGYPLNFLDHHLRPGNALIGAWLDEVATSEHPGVRLRRRRGEFQRTLTDDLPAEGEEIVQFSLLDDQGFARSLGHALHTLAAIEQNAGDTIDKVKQQEGAYAELRAQFVETYQRVMDLGTALFYDIHIENHLWGAYAAFSIKTPDEQKAIMGADKGFLPTLEQARTLGENSRFFHWELEFPEIFFEQDGSPKGEQSGFDAVVGNPPYVRQEKLSADKPFFQEHYEVAQGGADLFVYFFGQGLRLLRPGGRLAYISSNSWLRANYATALRRYLRTETSIEQIIDLGNTRVFADAPDLSPAIQIVRKLPSTDGNQAEVAVFARGDTIAEFRDNLGDGRLFKVSLHDQPDEGWQLRSDASRHLLARIIAQGRPLGEVLAGRMYYGIKTGLNEAFIIDSATRKRLLQADPASAQLIKPLVRGEDLRPWYQEDEGRWLIFAHRGVDIEAYPAIKAYLQQFRERLEPRPKALRTNAPWSGRKAGSYQWYELQDAIDYHQEFGKPKIFYPDIAKYPRFSWDEKGLFCNDKGSFLLAADHSLLGLLQSRVIWFYISSRFAPLAERERLIIYQHKSQYIKHIPIATLTDEQREQIGKLARQLTTMAQERYAVRRGMAQRVKSDLGNGLPKVTDRLDKWWRLDWQGFRDEVRKSFKREIPLKERSEWQELFQEQQEEIARLTGELERLEQTLNAAVYAVYGLNEEEIALVERETKYEYGEW